MAGGGGVAVAGGGCVAVAGGEGVAVAGGGAAMEGCAVERLGVTTDKHVDILIWRGNQGTTVFTIGY